MREYTIPDAGSGRLLRVEVTITPDAYPAGTRVVSVIRGDHGVVTGWIRDSIGVRWDAGGTSIGPASHGGLCYEPADA